MEEADKQIGSPPLQNAGNIANKPTHLIARVSTSPIEPVHRLHPLQRGDATVYTLSSKWEILPRPVHAIDASKHSRKSSSIILCHDVRSLSFIWSLQIMWHKNIHCPAEHVHGLNGSGVASRYILIFCISKSTICSHS
jgi:hypothetical protein